MLYNYNIQITMGSEQTKQLFNKQEWQTIIKTPVCTIIRNKITHIQYQQYTRVFSQENQFLKQRQLYEARQEELVDNVVKIEMLRTSTKKEICSIYYELIGYVEHFACTIEKIENLKFNECLYLLLEILAATTYLLKMYPELIMDESKIFINKFGKVKLWINNDVWKNEPSFNTPFDTQLIKSEKDQVQQIFDIIQSRSLLKQIPVDFIRPVRMSEMSLDQAISHIKLYCFENKIKLPNSIQKVLWNEFKQSRQSERKFTLTNTRVAIIQSKTSSEKKERRLNNKSVLSSIITELKQQKPKDNYQQCKLLD